MSTTQALNRPATAPKPGRLNVLVISALVVAAFSAIVLVGLGGWDYYTTPTGVRGYSQTHRVLRPAGRIGHLFGVGGFLMLLVPVIYSIRKKVPRFRNAGSMKTWLNVHVFCGIVGPVLVTFHTSFKFNGIVSVAYWSMVAVVLSGFVGRYLYVRIPRSLRGLELTQAELDARALDLSRELAAALLPDTLLMDIDLFERRAAPAPGPVSYVALFSGEIAMRREITRFRQAVARHGVAPDLHHSVIELVSERATLARRTAHLKKTKTLFDLWHVFHMPLVYIMFAIVVVHVAVTMYMGYVPFMD
jgi:hypothetical protein